MPKITSSYTQESGKNVQPHQALGSNAGHQTARSLLTTKGSAQKNP